MNKLTRKTVSVFLAAILLFMSLIPAGMTGALKAYAATNVVVDQNFNSLGTVATAGLPLDWKVSKEGDVRKVGSYGTAAIATERLGGKGLTSSASNGIYNFGAGEAANEPRAVGFISSGSATKSGNLYYKWTNGTGSDISSFTLSYDVEKFRNGSNPQGYSIALYYSKDGEEWTAAGNQFTISFDADGATEGAEIVPIATKSVTNQTASIPLLNGESLYFAWNYSVTSGSVTTNAQALGITNVHITAQSSEGPATVSSVVATPNGGEVASGTSVNLSTSTSDATINYVVYSPDQNEIARGIYSEPIVLNFNGTNPIIIKAIASADGMTSSNETTFTFNQAKLANVTAAPAGGEVAAGTAVVLSAASGATIYYTTNGDTPSIESNEYTGSIMIPSLPYTIKAIAVQEGYLGSEVATFAYTAVPEQNYSLDGETGTAVEWAISAASNFTQPIPATGGDLKEVSSLKLLHGGNEKIINWGSNGANSTGWDNGSGTKYWAIDTSTKGMADLTLSWRMRSSGSGPRDIKVQYSTDGSTWSDIPNAVIQVPNGGSLLDAANRFEVALPENLSNRGNLSFRWIMTSNTSASGGTVGSGGTHQINNIAITGAYVIGANQAYAVTSDLVDKVPLQTVVTFNSRTTDADIQYSTNGGNTYNTAANGQVTLTALPATLHVKAVKDGMDDSRVKTFDFTQAKVETVSTSPGAGAIPSNAMITLKTEPTDAVISYVITTKAGTEDENVLPEAIFTGPIALSEEMFPLRITAKATKENYLESDSISYNYSARKATGGEKNYFGMLHGHTINSDGAGTLEEAFAWARDEAKLDFFALTDHSNSFDTAPAGDKAGTYNLGAYNKDNARWQSGQNAAAAAAVPGEFVSFYGYEMTWSGGPGHINTFGTEGFVSRNNTELNNKTNDAGLRAYYELLKLHPEAIGQFNHPGTTFGNFNGFAYLDPVIDERISLIEIGNGEGEVGSGGYFPSYEQYDMALDKGWHLAPTNNQDNHKMKWGNSNTARTVVYTNDFTLPGILLGLKEMRVYATEDVNLDIVYTLNGEQLGTILNDVPDTARFKVDAKNTAGSNKVASISIITNGGTELYKQSFGTTDAVLDYELPNPKAGHYYIRVIQTDGRIAVTAPVWLGKAENVGISEFTSSTTTPVTTEELTLTTEVFNNEDRAVTLNSVKYETTDGELIANVALNKSIAASSSEKHNQTFTPTEAKKMTVVVTVSVTVNGEEKTYTKEIELNVKDISKLNYIGIDASHLNEYVAGNYKDSMKNLSTLAMQYGLRTVNLTTSEEFIAAAADPRYKMMIITAPTRRLNPSTGITHKFYSDEEIAAIAQYAQQGNPVIITGWADIYENYAYVTAGLDNHMAGQQNKLLAAIGSTLRIADDQAKDDVTNGGQPQRLYLEEHHDLINPLLEGMLEGQKFSQYGGSTVYAVQADGTPATILPSSVTPMVSGFNTTYSSDDDGDGYGFEDKETKVPRYGNSPDAGKGVGKVLLAASEAVQHNNDVVSQVVVAGGAFMSDFEIKNTALDNPADAYSNEVIVRNLLESIENVTITPIADIKAAEEGTEFTIEGIATVSVYDGNSENNTGFFDSIYVQDASGGINLFPVASEVQAGHKIRVTGVLSSYQGEQQLAVSSVRIMDTAIQPEAPQVLTTAEAMAPANTGKLIQTSGIVKRVVAEPNGTVNEITINDGTGEAIVYINAYITPNKSLSFVEVGAEISVIGLGSIGENFTSTTEFLPRLRVRDRGEIELITASNFSTVTFNSEGGTAVEAVTGIEPGSTITLPAAPTREGYTFAGWFTGRDGTGTAFTASTVVTSSVTVYANWVVTSGQGWSGGPIVTTPPTAINTTTDGQTTIVAATVKPTVNTATGIAKVVITGNEGSSIVEAAKKAEAAGQQSVVQIHVEPAADTQSIAVEIPRAAIDALADDTKSALAIQTGFGEVILNERALQAVSNAADAGAVTITINKVETSALTGETRSIVGDRPVFDYTVSVGDREVTDFDGPNVKIIIPYILRDGERENAVVAYYIDGQNRLQIMRGMYNSETKSVILTVSHFSKYAVGYNEVNFADVASGAWYNEAVGFIAARGITLGTGNNLYSPSEKLTRGQLIVMVMKAFGIAPSANGENNFADAGDTYYTGYLAAAKQLGIADGVGNNLFAPEKEISRQEMVTLLYNVLRFIGELPDAAAEKPLSDFSDASQISSWAKNAMEFFVETGLIIGDAGKLSPERSTTRAEMAQVFYNLLSQ